MGLFDLYDKKISLNSNADSELNRDNELFYTRHFKEDRSYKLGTLIKTDLTEIDLDTRIINVDRSTSEKKIYLIPNTIVEVGEYIKYTDKTYLVEEFESNLLSPMCKAFMCNQNLNWKGLSTTPIPCLITNSSYGSKGEVNTIIQMSDFDARAVITVGKNEYTEKIRNGMRFIFNNSKDDVYEITKKTTAYNSNSTNGYFQLTCKYVKWVQEDDFVNNIAFNSFLEDSFNPSIDISLLGEENIKIGTTQTYTIQNAINITFSLDEDTVLENNAEIVSQDGTSCVIRMLQEKMCQIECRNSLGISVINPQTIYGIK